MTVQHIPCGAFVNNSESDAFQAIQKSLSQIPQGQDCYVLTNVPSSVNLSAVPDEIDVIVVGPMGLRVIEVKHWRWSSLLSEEDKSRTWNEANKLNEKIKRLLGKLDNVLRRRVGFISGRFLLTAESGGAKGSRPEIAGSSFFDLSEVRALLGLDDQPVLIPRDIVAICKALQPITTFPVDGDLKRIGTVRELKRLSLPSDKFHRIYRGIHARTNDSVILHLYDLSARSGPSLQTVRLAEREADALRVFSRSRWVPQINDSFQDVTEYPGELRFFTIVDPSAPTLKARAKDIEWKVEQRILFSAKACDALNELHTPLSGEQTFVHRNITPETLLVAHDDQPLFTGFDLSRVPGMETISVLIAQAPPHTPWLPPEVAEKGPSIADQCSDTFALCASLKMLFMLPNATTSLSIKAIEILNNGTSQSPEQRAKLGDLADELRSTIQKSYSPTQKLPSVRYWSEGVSVLYGDRTYRVNSELGQGSFGRTYKVVELNTDGQDRGTYVGKVFFDKDSAARAREAYGLVRSHTTIPHLANIFEYSTEAVTDNFMALLQYVEGQSLESWRGLVNLVADECNKPASELIGEWLFDLCKALGELHAAGLVHGDVSARNIIVDSRYEVTLTDYDLLLGEGKPIWSRGTPLYAAPECVDGAQACCSNDIYSLASTLFHVALDREPFNHAGLVASNLGLSWSGIEQDEWGWIPEFLNIATNPDSQLRFSHGRHATEWIIERRALLSSASVSVTGTIRQELELTGQKESKDEPVIFSPQQVPWLSELLTTYPGSARGNTETRGLDTSFALSTYVPTTLDDRVFDSVRNRTARLVILCGNAGDGKTAFLQHLAVRLGLQRRSSSERIWEERLADGLLVKVNLDGAAAYQGRSADMLLHDFFAPFQDGKPMDDRAHLLAINNGRLLQWLESHDNNNTESRLTEQLRAILLGEEAGEHIDIDSHIAFVDLNERSLVGHEDEAGTVTTEFLDALVDKMIGGDNVEDIWRPCGICTAANRCTTNKSIKRLHGKDTVLSQHIRARLATALQAVHYRGQVHITTRELRATLTYIFFGTYYCEDLHADPNLKPIHYWDRAFDPASNMRQGDLLDELPRFDPALDSHPELDRHLTHYRLIGDDPTEITAESRHLASTRRQAYFELPADQVETMVGNADALGLYSGRHLSEFGRVPQMDEMQRQHLCVRLCMGIAQLEELPQIALKRLDQGFVPLKILPRTPVETAFWIEKPISQFELVEERPANSTQVDWLLNALCLKYYYHDRRIEVLRLNSDLFSLLLELADGYRLMGEYSGDVFANLAIFTQRLAEEDQSELFAWDPADDRKIHRVSIEKNNDIQRMKLSLVALDQEVNHG